MFSTRRVCQGSVGAIRADASLGDLQSLLSQLSGYRGSQAVVLMGGESFIRRIIQAAIDFNVGQDYIWLVASEWEFTEQELKTLIPNNYQLKVNIFLHVYYLFLLASFFMLVST